MDAEAWKKRYQREKKARKVAEQIAEDKTREIFFRNQELTVLAESLEEQVKARTSELEQKHLTLKTNRDELRKKQAMLKEVNKALEEKAVELEKVSQYKSEFLANISHELRTPLNSLMILATLLLENSEGHFTEDDLHSISIIYNNANELLEIIEDILDMSKAEAGELSVHSEDFRLSDIWLSLKDQFHPLAREKNLNFSIECADDLPGWVHIDRKRLKQVLKNLISNAFKFTPEKGVVKLRISKSVHTMEDQSTSEGLEFKVVDTGIGIPFEKQETIFQMFKQADGSTSRQYGGTGLGLAISRNLAQLMGGDLFLNSEVDKGSTFTLQLPPETLMTDEPASHLDHEENEFFLDGGAETEKSFNNETVLLVDDDLRNSFALSCLLQKQGLNVVLAENGSQALEMLNDDLDVDLVLMDLMMPTMDGYEALGQIRGRVNLRMLPVVMLTASAAPEDEKKCRAAGADDYLSKPVETSLLLDHLQRWLAH
ncbi:ATP-binding response regulator [Endozoicomonas numazuensis]|uniref:ATP-binding response regulator n=1 Tax=Endozoicomonas numazuensis TaxID=1137799 RepID=UPI000689FE79|nr:ATP-binding protein [Endozoicomonas numazuensis]